MEIVDLEIFDKRLLQIPSNSRFFVLFFLDSRVRQCSEEYGAESCYIRVEQGLKYEICYCNTDECNDAKALMPSLFLLTCAFVMLQKLFS
jgi:hypothetical protein